MRFLRKYLYRMNNDDSKIETPDTIRAEIADEVQRTMAKIRELNDQISSGNTTHYLIRSKKIV